MAKVGKILAIHKVLKLLARLQGRHLPVGGTDEVGKKLGGVGGVVVVEVDLTSGTGVVEVVVWYCGGGGGAESQHSRSGNSDARTPTRPPTLTIMRRSHSMRGQPGTLSLGVRSDGEVLGCRVHFCVMRDLELSPGVSIELDTVGGDPEHPCGAAPPTPTK